VHIRLKSKQLRKKRRSLKVYSNKQPHTWIVTKMRFRLEFKKPSPLWWRNVLYNSSATTTHYYYAGILMVMIFSSLYFSTISHAFAQHMMMPPAANTGDRKSNIKLSN
jgi:hypothetical protein